MKKIVIAATLAGIAGAATLLYVRKKLSKGSQEPASFDPNDHHRNALGRVMRNLKTNGATSHN